MSVARFHHLWQEQLPECLLPDGADANERFVELIKKALFYFCLDDKYLQEQLCNLKGDHITFKMFYDEACLAEQKRKSFQEIGVSSSHLDSASGISVNKWDTRYNKQEYNGNNRQQKWGNRSVKSSGGGVAESREQPAREPSRASPATTQYDSTRDSGAKLKKKKTPGACYSCQQMGHFAYKCPDKQRGQSGKKYQVSMVKKTEIEEEDDDSVNSPEFQFHSL